MIGTAPKVLARGVRALVGIVTLAALSRYLTPAEFGLFALVFFIVSLAQVIGDCGIYATLIVRQDPDPLEVDSMFCTSLGAGLLMVLGTIPAADLIADLFGDPRLAGPLRISAWVFVLMSMRSVPAAMMDKALRFREMAVMDLVAAVVGAITAGALAAAGQGVMALVMQQVVMCIVPNVLVFWFTRYRPRLRFSLAKLKPLKEYGWFLTLSSVIQYLAGNLERPIIGARLTASDLGNFSVAKQVVATPTRLLVSNAQQVAFPIMASIQDDRPRLTAAHANALHALALVMGPICCGLAAVAEPGSLVLLGPGWDVAGQVIMVASVSALVSSFAEMNGTVFTSIGRGRFIFQWSLFTLATNALLLWLLVPFGLMTMVWGRLVYLAVTVPLQTWLLARAMGCSAATLQLAVARPLLSALLMAVTVGGVDQLLLTGLSPLLRLIILVPTGAIAYIGLQLLIDRSQSLAFLNRVRRMLGG